MTRSHKPKNRCPVSVVDIARIFLFDHPPPWKKDLEICRKLYGSGDPKRCRRGGCTVKAVNHQCQGLRRSIDDGPKSKPGRKNLTKGRGVVTGAW